MSAFESELLGAAGAYGNPLLLEILKQGADNESDLENINTISSGVVGLSRFTGAISSSKAGILAQIGEYNEEAKDYSMIAAMIAGLIAFVITASVMIAMVAALLGFLLGLFLGRLALDFRLGFEVYENPLNKPFLIFKGLLGNL